MTQANEFIQFVNIVSERKKMQFLLFIFCHLEIQGSSSFFILRSNNSFVYIQALISTGKRLIFVICKWKIANWTQEGSSTKQYISVRGIFGFAFLFFYWIFASFVWIFSDTPLELKMKVLDYAYMTIYKLKWTVKCKRPSIVSIGSSCFESAANIKFEL